MSTTDLAALAADLNWAAERLAADGRSQPIGSLVAGIEYAVTELREWANDATETRRWAEGAGGRQGNAAAAPVFGRPFVLQRDADISGVSGTGTVADGIQFPDGTVAIRWRGRRASTVVWDSLDDARHIHGHGGATRIVWADSTPAAGA